MSLAVLVLEPPMGSEAKQVLSMVSDQLLADGRALEHVTVGVKNTGRKERFPTLQVFFS